MRNIFHPERFQGANKKKDYFEGWYFKHVFPEKEYAFAVIPGISLGSGRRERAIAEASLIEGPHAFVQFFDSTGSPLRYERYSIDDFSYEKKRFEVRIGDNLFTTTGIRLRLPNAGVRGEFSYGSVTPWPVTLLSPGAMGWFSYIPVMEDYHGVVSFDHEVNGKLTIEGKAGAEGPDRRKTEMLEISGEGRGYIEKDWGTSFPRNWIWMQTNNFDEPNCSLTLSVAVIPWMGRTFTGFITGLWYKGRLYRFCTYNRTRIKELRYKNDNQVRIVFENRKYRLAVEGIKEGSTRLKAPVIGAMDSHVDESLRSHVIVELTKRSPAEGRSEETVFAGEGHYAGLEIHGRLNSPE